MYACRKRLSRFICSPTVDNHSLTLAEYISKCLPAMESMACKIGQIAIGHIGQIKGCFTKVPPCVRARLKLCGNGVTSVQSVLSCFRVLSLHIGQIFCNMHHITDVTHYPQTDSASVRRIKVSGFYPAGGLPCVCSIASPRARYAPSRGLPAMRACMYRRRCPVASWADLERLQRIVDAWPAWLDASCRRSWSRISVGLHCSAMPCCYLDAWRC